jgi:hypothetical protein
MESFPKFAWRRKGGESDPDFIPTFISNRPSNRWVMCHSEVIFSDFQLWTAWEASVRRFERKTALARTIDAEFLRYLAGTNHVSEAFSRAGVDTDSNAGWLIYLPEAGFDEIEGVIQLTEVHNSDVNTIAVSLLDLLGCEIDESTRTPNVAGLNQLGIQDFTEPVDFEILAISHIHYADLQT